ncbi:ERV/ALR sulfhydryl oxidase domain-containing protein [Multifurca ochricompacta]|uniref:Sulfhydryl oxidase n=1 Tax=Multifurca ochricompacta TaxID=376703 RepID=A0AAD4M3R6_9AGAM|nr:ERV/ALR sulfhydryl oxidase domain-containing protein [Multifurca ochricompacta]
MISRFSKLFIFVILVLLLLASVTLLHHPVPAYLDLRTGAFFGDGGVEKEFHALPIQIHDQPPAVPHAMGNETAKALLGRATWKLLHTMTLRYPEHPTEDEREALKSYFYLTSRLYPCGECAAEFQQLLKLYPPQISSRLSASAWLCFVHNKVNERLQKPIFDCAHLDEEYDCGCGDDKDTPETSSLTTGSEVEIGSSAIKDELTGAELIKGGR